MGKKILIIVFLMLAGMAASAQYVDGGMLKRSGARIKEDGRKLSKEQQALLLSDIGGTDYTADWSKASGWRTAGIVITAGGAAVTLAGAAVTMVGLLTSTVGAVAGAAGGAIVGSIGGEEASQQAANEGAAAGIDAGKPIVNAGLVTAGIGAATLAAGIPIWCVNSHRLSGIVNTANQSREASLSLGPAPGGFGLCFTF